MFGISIERHKITVTKPASELIKERWSTDMALEMWTRAAARASTGPFASISFSADCLKWPIAVGGTESKSLMASLLEAFIISVAEGTPIRLNLIPYKEMNHNLMYNMAINYFYWDQQSPNFLILTKHIW